MAEEKPFNRDAAKQRPEDWFESPLQIVEHPLLTRGEKLATLERWRLNILGEMAAANEGMRTMGYSAEQLVVLEALQEAKVRLQRTAE